MSTTTATLPAPFAWAGEHVAIDLPGGRALFTTRRGGVSSGAYATLNLGILSGDERERVLENRDRVAGRAGLPRDRFQQGLQVHGDAVRALGSAPEAGEDLTEADGQATSAAGVAPFVLTADCLPIAVAGEGGVAMLHGGWRGLGAGIVAAGIGALRDLGVPGRLAAAIGPGAGPCCYEVGPEVHAVFAADGPLVRHGRNLDLKRIAALRLADAGVEEVHDAGLCTICSDPSLFFSHRRDQGVTGRQGGLAWRT